MMADKNPMTFVDLMSLEPLHSSQNGQRIEKFMSVCPPFNPGGGSAFGGHVYAQSVWAASQTVGEEMLIHVSVTGLDLTIASFELLPVLNYCQF
jgi:acyl-CoA thioesterase